MIGISVAAREEWEAFLKKTNIKNTKEYPFGEFCEINLCGENIIAYRSGTGKNNVSISTKYMIENYNLNKIITIGTCVGIDTKYKMLDIIFPNKFIQYELITEDKKTMGKLIEVQMDINDKKLNTGTIATLDIIIKHGEEYLALKKENITVADMESAVIAHICKEKNIECIAIKGISDFPIKDNFEDQVSNYDNNVPIIINKIIEDYLEYAIKNSFSYIK